MASEDYKCANCKYPMVSQAVAKYSKRVFGKVLCIACQKLMKGGEKK